MISRVLRTTHSLRKKLTTAFLRPIIEQSFPLESAERVALLKFLDAVPEVVSADDSSSSAAAPTDAAADASSSAATAASSSESSSSSSSSAENGKSKKSLQSVKTSITPEVEIYLHLLVLEFILQHGSKEEVRYLLPSDNPSHNWTQNQELD